MYNGCLRIISGANRKYNIDLESVVEISEIHIIGDNLMPCLVFTGHSNKNMEL